MKKFLGRVANRIKGDWLIILLDILAVNASYYLAILLRFYMHHELLLTVQEYPQWFLQFAPIYTVFCLLVFWRLRLYGGMWQYAGINDMNRIVGSSLITTVFMVIGTLIMFPRRFPFSYYAIGAIFQFLFVTAFRFGNRLWQVEKRKVKNWRKTGSHALVIGAGEAALRVIRDLEASEGIQPVCVLDPKGRMTGRNMDGVPVFGGVDRLELAIPRFDIKNVFIADLLQAETKNKIERICRENEIELKDYSYSIYLSGNEELGETKEVVSADASSRTIPFSPPDLSDKEISEVIEAMRSGWITTGPRTKLLERRLTAFIETGRADVDTEAESDKWKERTVCLSSATAAEELNLRILGIGPGDEVIVPAYTYTASASAAIHVGATVKFVDIRKDGDAATGMPEMDYEALEEAITPRTKAIIVVDLGGIVADYDQIFRIVRKKRNLFSPCVSDGTRLGELSYKIQKGLGCVAVISDAAHALGASRVVGRTGEGSLQAPEKRYCGRIAHFTSFSFHAVKNFTTAEGGASTWCLPKAVYDLGVTDREIYRLFQLMSLHGQNKDALAKSKAGAWEYDIVGPWYKCNMTDIMAAIGLRQLDRYPALLTRRAEMIQKYDAVCDELGLQHLCHHVEGMDSSNHLYLVRIPGGDEELRTKVMEALGREGVSTNVHYKPLPMMTAYKNLGWDIKDFPNAYDYYRNLFTLPLHTLLSDDDVETVCNALRKVVADLNIQTGKSGAKAC